MEEETRKKEIKEMMKKLHISRKEALLLKMYDPKLWEERRARAIARIERVKNERKGNCRTDAEA